LIADEFFNADQKGLAYKAGNLAPQDAKFNEHGWRGNVESPLARDLKAGSMQMKVTLTYDTDQELPVGTLVERKALAVRSGKEGTHAANVGAKKTLTVPRRTPSDWAARAEALPASPKKKRRALEKVPDATDFKEASTDPTRRQYTEQVRYSILPALGTTTTARAFHGRQGITQYDPLAVLNPVRSATHPEMGNFTGDQIRRRGDALRDGKKWRLMTAALIEERRNQGGKDPPAERYKALYEEAARSVTPGRRLGDVLDDAATATLSGGTSGGATPTATLGGGTSGGATTTAATRKRLRDDAFSEDEGSDDELP
jgi:hypothetical protein